MPKYTSGKRPNSLVTTKTTKNSRTAERQRAATKLDDRNVSTTVPTWMDELLDQQANIQGMTKSNILRTWLYNYAASNFPNAIPTV